MGHPPDYNVYPHMEVWQNGKLIGEWNVTGTAQNYTATVPTRELYYYHTDHLGTARLETDSTGTVVSNCTYAPFGQEIGCSPAETVNHYKFTGKERDSETGLDYFGARYYASIAGRFLSVDPDNADAEDENPQTWNAYTYVMDNPVRYIDPDGLAHWQKDHDGVNRWVGDKDGEVDQQNGTVWNAHRQSWDKQPAASGFFWDRAADWRRDFVSRWNQRIDAHRPPERRTTSNKQIFDDLNNLVLGLVPYNAPIARDITGKVHTDPLPDHIPDGWTREELEVAEQELRESIKQRKLELDTGSAQGAGHAERIRREERLLRQVEKKLSGS